MPYKDPTDPINIEKARASRRKHYLKNKEQYRKNNILKKVRMREYLSRVKDVPCMDCGVRYPSYVMDFDHRDPSEKEGGICKFVDRQSWNKLKKEIDKCDIVCANCHRVRSAKLLGYREFLQVSVNG